MAEKKANPVTKSAPKPIHATASPYQKPIVQQVEQPHHDIIADRLVNLLAPVKEHRAQHRLPRGKGPGNPRPSVEPVIPSPPTLSHLLVGFNHVTRHLEVLSTLRASQSDSAKPSATNDAEKPHVAAVFLFRPLDDLIYSHLPTLCHTASLAYPDYLATRLVLLEPAVEKRVVEAMGLPSVSILAVLENGESGETVSGLDELLDYVRDHFAAVEVPWVEQARDATWLGTKIETRYDV